MCPVVVDSFKGIEPWMGGLGAHGETAFLLCALKNEIEHRILMRFLIDHYWGHHEVSRALPAADEGHEEDGGPTADDDGSAGGSQPAPGPAVARRPPKLWTSAPSTGRGHRLSCTDALVSPQGRAGPPVKLQRLVRAAYTGPQFHGETALHFAIVHRDADMVRQLVEAGADPDAHADGLFFYERINTYFGGRPVGLAAHLGEIEILEYLAGMCLLARGAASAASARRPCTPLTHHAPSPRDCPASANLALIQSACLVEHCHRQGG